MSPTKLKETLKILADNGVGEYTCADFHVKFGPALVEAEVKELATYPKEPSRSLWYDKSLWPDGKPPEFQVMKREK